MPGTRRLAYADLRMRDFPLDLLHVAVTTAKLCGPGGLRAVIAEKLLLKHNSSSFVVVAGGRPVGLEFAVRPRPGAGRGPCSGRPVGGEFRIVSSKDARTNCMNSQ